MDLLKSLAAFFLFMFFLLTASTASASEGGIKDNLQTKIEPIEVNFRGTAQQFIRVGLTLHLAKQEVDEKIKLYMPVIRHRLILLLASVDAKQLNSIEGKQKLVHAINQAIGLTDTEGVVDVFFNSLIIVDSDAQIRRSNLSSSENVFVYRTSKAP